MRSDDINYVLSLEPDVLMDAICTSMKHSIDDNTDTVNEAVDDNVVTMNKPVDDNVVIMNKIVDDNAVTMNIAADENAVVEEEYAVHTKKLSWGKAKALSRRTHTRKTDFVSWQAQHLKSYISGTYSSDTLPRAAVPFRFKKPQTVENNVLGEIETKMESIQRDSKPRKKETRKILKTDFRKSATKEDITVIIEQKPPLETKVTRNDSTQTVLFDVDEVQIQTERHLKISDIRERLRMIATEGRLSLLRIMNEIRQVNKELEYQTVPKIVKKQTDKKKLINKLHQPPFIGGVSKSWNKNAAIKNKPKLPSEKTVASSWEGSPFKIVLLNSLKSRLQLEIVFRALKHHWYMKIACRRLCYRRSLDLERFTVKSVWKALVLFYDTRRWLRLRCEEQGNQRIYRILSSAFLPWKELTRTGLIHSAQSFIALKHYERRCKWKSLMVWRSELTIARYDAVSMICASHWYKMRRKFSIFVVWQEFAVYEATLRLRMELTAVGFDDILNRVSVPCNVEYWQYRKLQLKLNIVAQLDVDAKEIVSSVCLELSDPEYVNYFEFGRLLRKTTKGITIPGRRWIHVGLGRKAAKAPRAHLRALVSFLNGKGLVYHQSKHLASPITSIMTRKVVKRSMLIPWFFKWRRGLSNDIYERKLFLRMISTWRLFARSSKVENQIESMNNLRLWKMGFRLLDHYAELAFEQRVESSIRYKRSLQKRCLIRWRVYQEFWKLVSRRGMFSMWGRWRGFVQLAKWGREKRESIVKKRCLVRWKITHERRGLLVRVFTLQEEMSRDEISRRFDLLSSILEKWWTQCAGSKQAKRTRQQEIEADLLYSFTLMRKLFGAWIQLKPESNQAWMQLKPESNQAWMQLKPESNVAKYGRWKDEVENVSFLKVVGPEEVAFQRSAFMGLRNKVQ